MKLSSILTEAWRNLATGASRGLWFAFALALAGGGLATAEATVTQTLITEAENYRASGAAITTLVAPGRIDGRTCDGFSGIPGVTAAGAMRTTTNLKLSALPSSPVPAKEVTAGFPSLLGASPGTTNPGIFLSREVAEQFGLTPERDSLSTPLNTDQGDAAIAGVFEYPADGRRPGLGYSVLVPAAAQQPYDECWVATWPQSREIRSLIRLSLNPDSSGTTQEQPIVAQLNSRNGATFDGALQFAERITRFSAPAGLLIGAALGGAFTRLRRLELAAARHIGVSRAALTTQAAAESLVIAVAAGTLCLPVLCWVAAATGWIDPQLLAIGLKPVLTTTAAFVVAAGVGTSLISEKQLFNYFKNR